MRPRGILTSWSVRTKLLLLLLVFFLPASGIIVASGLEQRGHEITAARNNALLLVQSMAAQQEQIAIGTRQMLSTLARLPDVQRLDVDACNRLFRDLNQRYPYYSTIALVSVEGNMLAASAQFGPGRVNLSDRKHIKDAIRTLDFSAGEYIVGRVSGVQSLNYTHPVLDAHGNLIAIVVAGFKLDEYARFIRQANLPEGYAITIADHAGTRLYLLPSNEDTPPGKPIPSDSYARVSGGADRGTFDRTGQDGIHRIYAFKQLRLAENSPPYLYMIAGIPMDTIVNQANLVMLRNLLMLGVAAFIAVFLAWTFGNFLFVTPINHLVSATQRFGKGELGTRTNLPHTPDELGQLAKAFDDMASLLEMRSRERRMAEDALRESEEKYRALIETTETGYVILDRQGHVLDANDEYVRLAGRGSLQDILGRKVTDWTAAHDRERNAEAVAECVREGFVRDLEIDYVHRTGGFIPVEVNGSLIRMAEETVILAICRDITGRKQAEEALRASEGRYRSLFEDCPISLWELDSTGCRKLLDELTASGIDDLKSWLLRHPDEIERCRRGILVLDVNMATVQLLDSGSKEAIVRQPTSLFDSIPEEDFVELLAALAMERSDVEIETTVPTPADDPWQVIVRLTPLSPGNGGRNKDILSVIDISERKRAEEELLKIQKLESLGVLAGGIAHDFNNLLGMILSAVTYAQMDLNPSGRTFRVLKEAEKACMHSRNLTQQLITFSKGGAPIRKTQLLHETIRSAVGLALAGSNVICEANVADDLCPIDCDAGQIHQVLMNLIINAKEAMKEGGVLKLRAMNVILPEGKVPSLAPGVYARISIKDRGPGIAEADLPRVFDPYFSTKKRGTQKGMGLGLTIVYSIIQKHDGHVAVRTKPGVGTAFQIFLPASCEGITPVTDERQTHPPRLKGRVLFMDDEEVLRDIVEGLLDSLGYEVQLAHDGAEAIEIFRKAKATGKNFDVVILDLTVRRGMGGELTIRELRLIDPAIKAVVTSGYADHPVISHFDEHGFNGALLKPFGLPEVRDVLSRIVSGAPAQK